MADAERKEDEIGSGSTSSSRNMQQIPRVLPILPLENVVIFPYMVAPLQVTGDRSIQLIDDALVGDKLLGVCVQKDPKIDDPGPSDLYEYGTVGNILKMLKTPDGTVMILLQGLARMRIKQYVRQRPYLVADITVLEEHIDDTVELEALTRSLSHQFQKMVSLVPHLPDELQLAVANTKDPAKLADLITSNLNISVAERVEMLATTNVEQRLRKLTAILSRELDLLELGSKIQQQVRTELDKNQREFFLREQLKAIRRELGEGDDQAKEIDDLRGKITDAQMPEKVRDVAVKELDRLSKMSPNSAEYTVIHTYLDWLITLPWHVATDDHLDIERARTILEEDHYGLRDVKERILEYLAVRKLRSDSKGPILCFLGPPGVGKTSLGRSIARALGRKFIRLSLGGVRDEAEIRGHRRTYVGALPGRIIQSIRTAGTNNPVFMMDEIDKVGTDFRGDPSSALLEVLDPQQNDTFSDHYLDVPFDLSQVMFITTANLPDPIPPPLRDRMEMIEIPGYTMEEKVSICKQYLVPRQIKENGLAKKHIAIHDSALRFVIDAFTREAGLRNLEREIGKVCRKVARQVAEGHEDKVTVTKDNVEEYLGARKFHREIAERTADAGVVTGLAWTAAGGEVLFVESTRMPGAKGLTLTGSLGNVMKESAQAALSYIRSHSHALGIDDNFFSDTDLHVHVPTGAIPKDGPSAGVTIATSLYSLLTGQRVRPDVAMTGEITLRGKVLPVGGIKEKALAARRAGIKTIILPKWNQKDLEDIPEKAREELDFRFVDTIDEVWKYAFPNVTGIGKQHTGRHALNPAPGAVAAKPRAR